MARIFLDYIAEWQYKNGTWDHFLCERYETTKTHLFLFGYDSVGYPLTRRCSLEHTNIITVKPIGEEDLLYLYERKE